MSPSPPIGSRELDELRLVGLSRIPRCDGCPRLEALNRAVDGGLSRFATAPSVPSYCQHQVCRPLIDRHFGRTETALNEPPLTRTAALRKHA